MYEAAHSTEENKKKWAMTYYAYTDATHSAATDLLSHVREPKISLAQWERGEKRTQATL